MGEGGWMDGRKGVSSIGKAWDKGKKLCTDQILVLSYCILPSCDGTTFSTLNLEVPAAAPKLQEQPHWDLPAPHG